MAANFDVYLAKYATAPEKAHEMLVAKYDGKLVSASDARRVFGYTPVALTGVLDDVIAERVYSLKMPCCECSLSVCRRSDGEIVTVLEHSNPQPGWFGDRESIECLCNGTPTSVVQIDDKLAASWRYAKRHITLIGARDLDEVTRLVASSKPSGDG